MRREWKRPTILQPLDAVIGLDDQVVERVAVREQHVEVAVAIQIHDVESGRTPVRMRRDIDRLLPKAAAAFVEVGYGGLVFLCEQRDDVGAPVAVDVCGNNVDGPGPSIQHAPVEPK